MLRIGLFACSILALGLSMMPSIPSMPLSNGTLACLGLLFGAGAIRGIAPHAQRPLRRRVDVATGDGADPRRRAVRGMARQDARDASVVGVLGALALLVGAGLA